MPAPTLTAPPIFMQVLVPSILTKPAPYSAQALAEFERFSGSSLPAVAALSACWGRGCSAATAAEASTTAIMIRRDFRIPPFIAPRRSGLDHSVFERSGTGSHSNQACADCVDLSAVENASNENLADELDADRFAAAPDHLAATSGPGVARKRQPQLRRQRIGIVDRDFRPGRGQVLHHALPRGKTALERDPAGLAQRFARLALFAR